MDYLVVLLLISTFFSGTAIECCESGDMGGGLSVDFHLSIKLPVGENCTVRNNATTMTTGTTSSITSTTIPSTTPTIPSTTPTSPSTTPTIPSTTPTIPSTTPTISSTTPAIASTTLTIPSTAPTIPSTTPTIPSITPTIPSTTPTIPSTTPTIPSTTPTPTTTYTATTARPTCHATSKVFTDCPSDWKKFNSNCYKYFSEKVNWLQAKDRCCSKDSDLVSMHSKAESDFVAELAFTSKTCSLSHIGLRYDKIIGHTWTDGSPYNYENLHDKAKKPAFWPAVSVIYSNCYKKPWTGQWGIIVEKKIEGGYVCKITLSKKETFSAHK